MVLVNCSLNVYGWIYVLMLLLFDGGYTMHTIIRSLSLCYVSAEPKQLVNVYHIILNLSKQVLLLLPQKL